MDKTVEVSQAARDAVEGSYAKPAHGWTCFHCGETFTTPGSARNHFGFDPSNDPACVIKVGAERGLVMELRKAEQAAADAWQAIGDESTEAARAYYAQTTRHHAQIVAAEEAGYEKGLADGRLEANTRATQPEAALREALANIKGIAEAALNFHDCPDCGAVFDVASAALKDHRHG